MDLSQAIKARRSVRAFAEGDVTDAQLTTIFEAAMAAPSAGNRQPWHFYAVRDKARIGRIVEESCGQPFLLQAPVLIVVCANQDMSSARYHERGAELYCLQDTAAAIQNMLLTVTALGLGACWCGAFDEEALKRILPDCENLRPVAVIPVGVPAQNPQPRPRRPLSDIVTYI